MKSEDWVSNALRTLAEQDHGREAPQEVETRVLAAFRQRRVRRKLKAVVLASLAAAAVITLFFATPAKRPQPVVPVETPKQVVAVAPEPVAVEAPLIRKAARPIPQQPREIVTEFFPLLDVAPPFERGELLRVTVPMATMRRVGLPVHEDRLADRIYADVLVGEEGLARAIRFVSYE